MTSQSSPAARDESRERTGDVAERVAALAPWHYEFDLAGTRTPVRYAGHRWRQPWRMRHIWPPLLATRNGSLEGQKVLDLGCNAGYFSLAAIESGCAHVSGIDARPSHIAQAELVFEVRGVEPHRYRFSTANVFDYLNASAEHVDVVLCLGLLYHTANPFSLLEAIVAIEPDVVIIDSSLSSFPGSVLELRYEDPSSPNMSADSPLVMVPTKSAVVEIMSALGFRTQIVKPQTEGVRGIPDYASGTRRLFVCERGRPTELRVPTELAGDISSPSAPDSDP